MTVVLFRVDERLIHGQVVIGWGSQIHPDRYVVVDDELALSEWEQELYRLSVAEGAVEFLSVEEAAQRWPEWLDGPNRGLLLTRDLDHMHRLVMGGDPARVSINLGGIHHRAGRVAVRPYLCLNEEDRDRIRSLAEAGATVTGQDLPGSAKVGLKALLGTKS